MCNAGKRMKFVTKPIRHYPPHLRRVATLPWKLKIQISGRLSTVLVSHKVFSSLLAPRIQRFSGNSSVNFVAVYPFKYQLFKIKTLSSSLNTMLIVDKHCSDVCCDEFSVPQLIAKVNNQKNSDMKSFICNQYGERHPIFKLKNIKICGRVTKLEVIRMQYACIFFHIGWISAEIWIFNFPRCCSNMPKVRWAMSYGFCTKFHTLSSSVKVLRIG